MTNAPDGMSILVTGLGGQGVMLASKALAAAAERSFAFVSRTESRGLSQRGGSVWSEVRFSNRVLSTSIGLGHADLVLSLDRLEAMRNLNMLKPNGMVLTNSKTVIPVYLLKRNSRSPAAAHSAQFDEKYSACADLSECLIALDLNSVAGQFGYSQGLNVVLLGSASILLPFGPQEILREVLNLVPSQHQARAASAFQAGRDVMMRLKDPRLAAGLAVA